MTAQLFDIGSNHGYHDYLHALVTYDTTDALVTVSDDDEYREGYLEGVDQAKTDMQNGGRHPHTC